MQNIIARTYAKNQQSSWNDDPFGLGALQGVTPLSHSQALSEYAQELVSTYAKYKDDEYRLSVAMLPEHEQNELARLYMEATDRETGECVHGKDLSIENEYTCALLEMLKSDCTETRQNFAQITKKNIIAYYTNSLDELLSTACLVFLHASNNENNLYAHADYANDDFIWSRI